MNLIELHILQSFPVNTLNRDQFGSPKSAIFGGASRARVSSQCWKRAIREFAKEESPMFNGSRSKYFEPAMLRILTEMGHDAKRAEKISREIFDAVGIKFDKEGSKNLLYFSDGELKIAAEAYLASGDPKKAAAAAVKELGKVTKDGVDIAFFGRMVADSDLTLEGAACFSHALSTHAVSNDIDFFTAVDDLRPGDVSGSSHMGDLEFNSACYYRYINLNLDLLADEKHLGALSVEERREAVASFLRAVVMAIPTARQNSMAAPTLPGTILGFARKGSPYSLANAFEKPVRKTSGLLEESAEVMMDHWRKMKETYDLSAEKELILPDVNLKTMIGELCAYVK